MSAIPLTLFLSLVLAGLFTLLFWREQRRRDLGGAERDSLLPLAEETPRAIAARPRGLTPPAGPSGRLLSHVRQEFGGGSNGDGPGPADSHDHDHAAVEERCGCRDGLRPPCAGCRRHEPASR